MHRVSSISYILAIKIRDCIGKCTLLKVLTTLGIGAIYCKVELVAKFPIFL